MSFATRQETLKRCKKTTAALIITASNNKKFPFDVCFYDVVNKNPRNAKVIFIATVGHSDKVLFDALKAHEDEIAASQMARSFNEKEEEE